MPQNALPSSEQRAPVATPSAPVSTIILLNNKENALKVEPFFLRARQDLTFVVAELPEELENIPLASLREARLVCVGGTTIVPPSILEALGYGAYNFHPGPPTHPGWAPFNFALYDGVPSYGTTVHHMVEKVDAGGIVSVDFFAVPADAGIEDLLKLTRNSLARQLEHLAGSLVTETTPLPTLPIPWAPRKSTKKQFAAYCTLPPDIERDELLRRLRAFGAGDGYSVPTLIVNGRRFVLATDQHVPGNDAVGDALFLHGIRFVLDRVS